ncbi:helix-turn-helix transcriptional regulator [Staphylococcus nepalensis]|uniref:helix-turn-helix domain-containing protein n=1 Tax=Staphylococcus TaxID=1279 RepID=UPI002981D847|nr:helix-turn-helix transcriptional regulator [Staphylococcus equorum]MDW5471726.1 helix-turn-helix transcriptional regulator [Staphylococcus equorum]
MNTENLGEIIKTKRKKVNISNRQLSIDASMSRTYLYNIEKGKQNSPKADIVVRIANAFTKYGYDKFETMSELLERIEGYTQRDKMEILKKEKYFEQSKYKLLNENTEKNDLNYILSSISNDATFDLKIGGINKKVVLDDNMKKFIKETIKPMIKLYMSK